MKLRVVLAITCTILLTACGGGGGGGTAGRMGGDQSPLPNTFVLGDVLIYAQGQRTRLSSSCIGARCTLTYQGQSETIDVRDIDPRSGPNVRITGEHVRNGVQVIAPAIKASISTHGALGQRTVRPVRAKQPSRGSRSISSCRFHWAKEPEPIRCPGTPYGPAPWPEPRSLVRRQVPPSLATPECKSTFPT